MSAESRLQELGLTLPDPPTPGGSYVPLKRAGSLVYLSGILSRDDQGTILKGTAGEDRTVENAARAARYCVLSALAVLHRHLGLNNVRSIVNLTGYIRATPEFDSQARVMDAASKLLIDVFGEAGHHARTSIGVIALPRHALVEIQLVVEV